MIILISGNSCTGKSYMAQQLLERYHVPYLSIDHLKIGLIQSGYELWLHAPGFDRVYR
jgi:adenylate kinase family enzyme